MLVFRKRKCTSRIIENAALEMLICKVHIPQRRLSLGKTARESDAGACFQEPVLIIKICVYYITKQSLVNGKSNKQTLMKTGLHSTK